MLLGILKETASGETRVALLPDFVKTLVTQGIEIAVEQGAGLAAGALDEAYTQAGAEIATDRSALLSAADLLPVVNAPDVHDQQLLKAGCIVIGFMRPLDAPQDLKTAVVARSLYFQRSWFPASRGHRPWTHFPRWPP